MEEAERFSRLYMFVFAKHQEVLKYDKQDRQGTAIVKLNIA
jgi:hypothetical protein